MTKRLWCVCLMLLVVSFSGFAQGDSNGVAITASGGVSISDSVASESVDPNIIKCPMPPMPDNDRDVVAKIKNMRADTQKLIRQRLFARAEVQIEAMKKVLNSNQIDNKTRMALIASISRSEAVRLYSAQGNYNKAANAVRTAIKYNSLKSDMQLLLKTQGKVKIQSDWLNTRIAHEKSLQKLQDSKTPLLKEKLEVLRKMNTKRMFSSAELKKLQLELRVLNQKLARLNKVIREENRLFAIKRGKMRKADVVLSAEQHKKLFPYVMKRMQTRMANYRLKKEITKHLSNVVENTEVTWKNLKTNFESLKKIQKQIWSLRKRLDYLASKAPLSEADYRAAKAVRSQLEKALAGAEKIMGKVEKAFVDAKTFAKLSMKEKLAFVKLFQETWSQDKEFESLKPSLEELYKKIFDAPIVIDDPIVIGPKPVEPVPDTVERIKGQGYIVLEGNIFMLRFKERVFYPINLPARYRINKLEVEFAADIKPALKPMDKELQTVSNNDFVGQTWWDKYPRASFTYISAPQLPDEPYEVNDKPATPTQVIEENIDNKDQPSNLMNAF